MGIAIFLAVLLLSCSRDDLEYDFAHISVAVAFRASRRDKPEAHATSGQDERAAGADV